MPTQGMGAIGSLDYTKEERQELAQQSRSWTCPTCGLISTLLKKPSAHKTTDAEKRVAEEQKELARQICFKVIISRYQE